MDILTQSLSSKDVLPLMEEYYTIQGEGFFTGKAAYFVRLAGCDVGCHWCDVKESWDSEMHPKVPITKIVENITVNNSKIAVITGGEPLMHNLSALTKLLKENHIRAHVETSGSHALSGNWDWICFSPKKFKQPLPEVAIIADELKVVIFNKHDFEWAEANAKLTNKNCILFLQPEWSKATEMLPLIIKYVKENPKWRISLQTHKYINIP